jgi:AraC-like DNA-binding protein
MEQHLLDIHNELTRQSSPDHTIVQNLLENWLRFTARALRQEKTADAVPKSILTSRHFIESEYARPLALPDLAASAKLSVSHFCAEFKRHLGMAPIEYLINHRMRRAAFLLQDQELTISAIGNQVGYEDLFHFSKLFKKHFGVSPREFRKRKWSTAGDVKAPGKNL